MSNNERPNIEESSWEEFANAGLFWWVNRSLHLFGWVLVYETYEDSDKVSRVYPAMCRYRGFSEEVEESGFRKVTAHIKSRMSHLLEDVG